MIMRIEYHGYADLVFIRSDYTWITDRPLVPSTTGSMESRNTNSQPKQKAEHNIVDQSWRWDLPTVQTCTITLWTERTHHFIDEPEATMLKQTCLYR